MTTSLVLVLILLVVVLAGAGLLAYRLASWQTQGRGDLENALVKADAQRERLVAVLRSVPHGLLVLDCYGMVLMANEQAAGL